MKFYSLMELDLFKLFSQHFNNFLYKNETS